MVVFEGFCAKSFHRNPVSNPVPRVPSPPPSREYFIEEPGNEVALSSVSYASDDLIIALKEVFLCSLALSQMLRQELRTSLVQKSAAERKRNKYVH